MISDYSKVNVKFQQKIWAVFVIGVFSILLLSSCSRPTDPDRDNRKIAFLNERLAPEGHITKTHLYISWPAEVRNGEEIAKPLMLKIPLEYLSHDLFWTGDLLSVDGSIILQDHKITSVSLRMMPEAQPIVPEKYYPVSTDTPAIEKVKAAYFHKAYTVFINRNTTKVPANSRSTDNTIQVSSIAGLERYVPLTCYDLTELKKRGGRDYQRALLVLGGKAKDDQSLANCVADRNLLFLQSPQSTPIDKAIGVECYVDICSAAFVLKNHAGYMRIATENPIDMFTRKIQAMHPPQPYQQPRLNEIWTDLPRWQQRVDPTMQLLNSLVISETQPKANQ